MPKPYGKTMYDEKLVDELTKAALEDAAGRLGYDLTIVQGSYNPGGVGASGGTHDGGGVVDLSAWDHGNKVREMRRLGFAAWYRPTLPGVWNEHIHAVQIGNRKLSPAAKAQVDDYIAGKNGLADHGPDNGPRQFVNNRYRWKTGGKRISSAAALLRRAKAKLASGVRGYNTAATRRAIDNAIDNIPKH